jgi:GMP synthase-like glutamine amidotransferase
MEDGDRNSMILIIKICKISFHYFEFVKPIEDILKKINKEFITIHYNELTHYLISKADKVIICGTSLRDNSFLLDFEKFNWIKEYEKPVLGICGGMHLLGLVYDGKLKKTQEIGLKKIEFKEKFFDLAGKIEVYELHNLYVESKSFEVVAKSEKCPQVVKHKHKPFYAVLFHPEVRNKKLIERFVKI